MRTDGTLYWAGATVWHSGNLTNLNQLSNGPGYITSSGTANNSNALGGFAASAFIRKGENVDTALGDSTDERSAVLTLNNTHTDSFTANSDIGDARRVLTIQNPTSNTGNGRFTAMQFQILGDVSGNRTMGDLKFVRESARRGRWYFTSTDASGNWHDSLSISSHSTVVSSRGNAGGSVFEIRGTSGQLFSVTDSLTGTIFAASDVSGIPILEVNSNGTVTVDNTLNVFGDVTAFFSSDERLKDNVTPISNAIEKIKLIGGYEFDWNGLSKNTGHDVGVIAQEVEKVLPEVVTTRDTGFKAVKYDRLTALLIQANKELIERVEYLESKLK
jgi:hypothetical protein